MPFRQSNGAQLANRDFAKMDRDKNVSQGQRADDALPVPTREDLIDAFQRDDGCAAMPLEWILDHCDKRRESNR